MMKTTDLRGCDLAAIDLSSRLPRATLDVQAALKTVRPLIASVRKDGVKALREMAKRFDGVDSEHIRIPVQNLHEALENLDGQVRKALEIAIDHNRRGHQAQMPVQTSTDIIGGGRVIQRWQPVSRVGLYVPAGLAIYPSSVVMNVVAAQVAGVKEIALASPAQKDFDGLVHPTIMAACALLGVEEVYAMGGAGAIAAFAYGVKDANEYVVPPVDVITGPGNIYVAAAKRAVSSVCAIDAEAGTTEIAIIADASASPVFVAADLISQAEHDPKAASVLITDSQLLIQSVEKELEVQIAATKHAKRVKEALQGPQSGYLLVDDIPAAIEVANAYGAEHLEIQCRGAMDVAEQIVNAGAIFVGPYSPVPLGDYLAGSNHVLPTGGSARFTSGLSVMVFLKSMQMIEYSAPATASLIDPLIALAQAEDLPAHGQSLEYRRNR